MSEINGLKNAIYIQKEFFNTTYDETNLKGMLESWAGGAYRKVFTRISDITNRQIELKEDKDGNARPARNEYDNNIIAITGGRGSGKSSLLNNVTNFLRSNDTNEDTKYDPEIKLMLSKAKYTCLGILDPTIFNESDIMEVMISWLFGLFKDKLEGNKDTDKKRDILRGFEEIYKYLKMIRVNHEKRMDGDYIEILDVLSSTTKLKDNLNQLIKETLCFVNSTKEKCQSSESPHQVLVIAIDDFDQEYDGAYKTLEMIRKYLIIPNVIVLLGVNMPDLERYIEHNIAHKAGSDGKSEGDAQTYKTMGLNYLQKLIPDNHRIAIPNLMTIQEGSLLYIEGIDFEKDKGANKIIFTSDQNSTSEKIEIQGDRFKFLNRLSKHIYDTTNVLFLPDTEQMKLFFKMSLRDLNEFICFLNGFLPLDVNKKVYTFEQKRLMDFLINWFRKTQEDAKSDDYRDSIPQIVSTDDIISIVNTSERNRNKITVQYMVRWVARLEQSVFGSGTEAPITTLSQIHPSLKDADNTRSNPRNVTYADIREIDAYLDGFLLENKLQDALKLKRLLLSVVCKIEFENDSNKEHSIPFYHGLISHVPLVRPGKRFAYRDTISFNYKNLVAIHANMTKDVLKLSVGNNDVNSLMMKSLESAFNQFRRCIYPRFPFPRKGYSSIGSAIKLGTKSISNRKDVDCFYDLKKWNSMNLYTKVVFSIQAYFFNTYREGIDILGLADKDIVERLFENPETDVKERNAFELQYLAYFIVTMKKRWDDLRRKYSRIYPSTFEKTIERFDNDDLISLLIHGSRIVTDKNFEQNDKQNKDDYMKLYKYLLDSKNTIEADLPEGIANLYVQCNPMLSMKEAKIFDGTNWVEGVSTDVVSKSFEYCWFNMLYTFSMIDAYSETEDEKQKTLDGTKSKKRDHKNKNHIMKSETISTLEEKVHNFFVEAENRRRRTDVGYTAKTINRKMNNLLTMCENISDASFQKNKIVPMITSLLREEQEVDSGYKLSLEDTDMYVDTLIKIITKLPLSSENR